MAVASHAGRDANVHARYPSLTGDPLSYAPWAEGALQPKDSAQPESLMFSLTVERDRLPPEAWARFLEAWFDAGLHVAGGPLQGRAPRAAPGPGQRIETGLSSTVVGRHGPRARFEPFSPPAWQRFVSRLPVLLEHPGETFTARIARVDGGPGPHNLSAVEARAKLMRPPWLVLQVYVPEWWMLDDDYARGVVSSWQELAARVDVAYGEVGHYYGMAGQTLLERLSGRHFEDHVDGSRSQVRGYGWVTVLAGEVGDALGGVEALAGSGAFAAVRKLDAGAYWLQASERFADFDMSHVEAVFRALAPMLPAGRPRDPSFLGNPRRRPYLVVIDDPQR